MHVAIYAGLLHAREEHFAHALDAVADGHADRTEITTVCRRLATAARSHMEALVPHVDRDGAYTPVRSAPFAGPREGNLGMLRDLHELAQIATAVHLCWLALYPTAKGAHDDALAALCARASSETDRTIEWLKARIRAAAPGSQVLID